MGSVDTGGHRPTTLGRLARIVLVVVLVLAPVAAGAAGYYLGRSQPQSGAEPTSYPVWTDQEIRSIGTGTALVTLRCTYHRADGTSRVTETVVVANVGANTPRCPSSP
jgi:hypothetical protein